jgi:hypothetical protein
LKKKKWLKYTRKKIGELFIFAGFVLIFADIYLGWQDGVWNRYPLSMLMADTAHLMGLITGSMLPLLERFIDTAKNFEVSKFPHSVQIFLSAVPMATIFLVSGYFFLKWAKYPRKNYAR